MAERVVLHVGTMKSGTSFIQQTLGANRERLTEQGYLFPGKRWRHQVLGVIDVLDQRRDGAPVPGSVGAWKRLLREMEAWEGTAIISMEFLAANPAELIQRVVDSLAPARVEVVVTARDLGRNIPAMWQEGLKNSDAWDWAEYLEAVRNGDPAQPGDARKFWRHMAYPAICRKWADAVGRENVTLLTVPHPGAPRTLLWERFCSVVGLDPAPFDLSSKSNVSIPAASALVMRALNERLLVDGMPAHYPEVVKHSLAKQGMVARKGVEPPIGFQAPRWVGRRAAGQIRRLKELDLRVVGDLEELRPVSQEGVDPTEVTVEQQLDAALAALTYLVRTWPAPSR